MIKKIVLSLIISVGIWVFYSWPLPLHFQDAMPHSAQNSNHHFIQYMQPGDHLQLMFHFWLLSDMIQGKTPWFYNPYEFNRNHPKEQYKPGTYYIPYSLFFSFFHLFVNQITAWNLTIFASIWLYFFFSLLIINRYIPYSYFNYFLAFIPLSLPYYWINLFGGSPAGFGFSWIFMLILGIDITIREQKIMGAFIYGIAILFASFTDHHIFFFGVLSIPLWITLSLMNSSFNLRKIKSYYSLSIRNLPAICLLAISLLIIYLKKFRITESLMSQGRTIKEISLFSPDWINFFTWNPNVRIHIYIGFTLIFLLISLLAFHIIYFIVNRQQSIIPLLTAIVLSMSFLLICVLSLGVSDSYFVRVFFAARKLIPPYEMIRQPAKILCLIPGIIVFTTIFLYQTFHHFKVRPMKPIIFIILICLFGEFKHHIHANLTTMETNQAAYQAIIEDSIQNNITPRGVAVPLWPGDSHYSSIYEYFASLYHIELLNGYSPIVSKSYFESIFKKFESINKGYIKDANLNELEKMNIHYVIFHEDVFPSKVSPLAPSYTLNQFLKNPRLQLLKHHETVWAFKITELKQNNMINTTWNTFFPSKYFELEKYSKQNTISQDIEASNQLSCKLNNTNLSIRIKEFHMNPDPNNQWLVRLKGEGSVQINLWDNDHSSTIIKKIYSKKYQWIQIPHIFNEYNPISIEFHVLSGSIDFDSCLFYNGSWNLNPEIHQKISIDPAQFFHAGYIDDDFKSIVLNPKLLSDQGIIFFGPKLPLEPGKYQIKIVVSSDSSYIPVFNIRIEDHPGNFVLNEDVISNQENIFDFFINDNLPDQILLTYSNNSKCKINQIEITRYESI